MITRNPIRQTLLAAFIALACASGALASATAKHECPDPSKEDREKMAAAHEQMAACLRSDKPAMECHKELAKSQHQMMQMMGCPGGKHMRPHEGSKSETNPTPKA